MSDEDEGPLLTKNRAGNEHCSTCCDEGWTYDGVSKNGTEQTAPCPFCEQGRRNELLHYGLTGYWQGRAPLVETLCRCREKPAPPDQETLDRFLASLAAAKRTMDGLSPSAMADAMERMTPAAAGRCSDCGVTAERVHYGSFDLCDSCIRARLGAQAAVERLAGVMRSGEELLADVVPPARNDPSSTTTEGGPVADRG